MIFIECPKFGELPECVFGSEFVPSSLVEGATWDEQEMRKELSKCRGGKYGYVFLAFRSGRDEWNVSWFPNIEAGGLDELIAKFVARLKEVDIDPIPAYWLEAAVKIAEELGLGKDLGAGI